MISSQADIKQLGTILTVWAHPDDETFLAGGIMATAVRHGQPVICITATHGEAGSQDHEKWPPAELGDVRTKELANALGILGIPRHHWLDYPDGGCNKVSSKEAVARIKAFIERYRPDTILTFGPDGLTGHPDHATVSAWVSAAVSELDQKPVIYQAVHTNEQYEQYLKEVDAKLNVFFNIDKPPLKKPKDCDICYELPKEIQNLKYEAFASMPSQMENMLNAFGKKFICTALGSEAFVKVK